MENNWRSLPVVEIMRAARECLRLLRSTHNRIFIFCWAAIKYPLDQQAHKGAFYHQLVQPWWILFSLLRHSRVQKPEQKTAPRTLIFISTSASRLVFCLVRAEQTPIYSRENKSLPPQTWAPGEKQFVARRRFCVASLLSTQRERERKKKTFFLSRLTACHALVSLLGGPRLRWAALGSRMPPPCPSLRFPRGCALLRAYF